MRDGYIYYSSFYNALKNLDKPTRSDVRDAIDAYAIEGIEPELEGVAAAVFELVRPQLDANNKRYENGKKGGRPKQPATEQQPSTNQNITNPEPKEKDKEKVKEILPDGNTKKSSRFSKPTVEEIKAYCAERRNKIDAQHFYDYQESRGWVLSNGKKMQDWKATIRTWERNNFSRGHPIADKKNFEQHQYTPEDIERQKMAALRQLEELDSG